jgi:hypothetical protein
LPNKVTDPSIKTDAEDEINSMASFPVSIWWLWLRKAAKVCNILQQPKENNFKLWNSTMTK